MKIAQIFRELFCRHEWVYTKTDETGIITITYGDGTIVEKEVFCGIRFCLKCGKIL